ncbi:MAG: Gfo/Idh/MocA family protein [Bacillota bacterium]
MRQINFAIVGFGGIAKTHALAAYDANLRYGLPYQLNLTHVVTRKPIDIPLPNVQNVTDIEEVLKDENIHFIDICTPNDSHLDIVKKAVAHGKAIYCEKPLASNYKDALEMTTLVKEKNIPNAVALMYRFMPAVHLLKKELEAKTIGDIIDFKIRTYHKSYLSEKKKGTWRTKANEGKGAILDLGVHLIDLVQFTLGDIVKANHHERIYFKERTQVDEITNSELILENGIMGHLEASRIFAEKEETDNFEIYGTKGSIRINFLKPYEIEVYHFEEDYTEIKKPTSEDPIMKYYASERSSLGFFQNCHTASLIHFANEIYGQQHVEIAAKFNDALKCQKIIDGIME